ncbi:MAG: TIGR03086 family protein [Streptosporangiales bacterium]|nr:TIGR03086 family protein [Streptosporangiales bacterium]
MTVTDADSSPGRVELGPQAERIKTLADGISDAVLGAPTPCPGFTVRAMLNHMLLLTMAFRVAAEKGPDLGPPPEAPPDDLPSSWRELLRVRLDALAAAWREPDAYAGETSVGGVTLPAPVAARVALTELLMHGWDLAKATGLPYAPDETTVAECMMILADTPEEGTPGLFGPVVKVPDDAPPFDRALALAGRDPAWTPADARGSAPSTGERMVATNGVELCAEAFGDPAHPAILLSGGGSHSMLFWDEEFCERLAAAGRYVVRYDQRDTGRSTTHPPGDADYRLADLAVDACGLLDGFGVDRAHVVGFSLGGGIGQVMALDHADRVASLTLIATSPVGPGGVTEELPGPGPEFEARLAELGEPGPDDREAAIAHGVGFERLCAADPPGFEEAARRERAGRVFDRAINLASIFNHTTPAFAPWPSERLGEIGVPTLVVHGRRDPVLPYPHGKALAAAIPGAGLLTLEHGHDLLRSDWDVLIPAIVKHTEA